MVLKIWTSHATLALALLLDTSSCLHILPDAISTSLRSQYDYIIVGGGASGLVVANRLTEDPFVTVLVLEAGILDAEEAMVTVPGNVGDDLWSVYDWKLETVAQQSLDGQTVAFNQGKVIGGGTILNGMVWTRGSAKDYDSWGDLNDDGETNMYNWRWNDLLPYFMKNEHFTLEVDAETQERFHIHPNMAVHSMAGPISVTYPHFLYDQSANIISGMVDMGLSITNEPNDGTCLGAMTAPSSMSVQNQSRSDSRTAYFDTAIDRQNLHIATEQTVTQILLETVGEEQRAVGVEFAHSNEAERINVTCSNEVIMAAGAIFSPTLLQLSGIGPENVLSSLGIQTRIDLPGVGANFQDHGMIHPIYSYTNPSVYTADDVTASSASMAAANDEYYNNHTGPLTAPLISTVAFPAMEDFADDWAELIDQAQQRDVDSTLPPGTEDTVRQGYLAQRQLQIPLLRDSTEGAIEILADSIGTISLAMQRPLSRGTVRPSTSNIFDSPLVDPRYCSEPFDCLVLARALLFNCGLIRTGPMAELQPVVQAPYFCPNFTSSTTDAERASANDRMLALAKQHIATEFHPSGSTAMMPLELGGVVDTELKVYGTQNLRVVDAGVMPMVLGAHLQSAVYAIAERAADIIRS
ncbi:Oxygen-dependent choline dehydrogenase [Cytospora mali]|uniref:Oxygen-dependent choline dehydrogenase n=1 Tax=Cytospora mali TaxID=578113 RepID=A0A194VWZ7_CYTMA|nr:Oxygen-dependent choline dehydrogenase [Valsa mali]